MKSDAEVICEFMEPRPSRLRGDCAGCPGQFWRYAGREGDGDPVPTTLTLDALHEAEERLSAAQRKLYMADLTGYGDDCAWRLVHATAEQKIRALAAVLRDAKPEEGK